MVIDLKKYMEHKAIAHIKSETDKLKQIPMNRWYCMNDGSKMMRVPGFLVYNVEDKPLFSIPFPGGVK